MTPSASISIADAAKLQLPRGLVQAPGAAEAEMGNHAATTFVPLATLTGLPWKLWVASAALCWPSDNNLAVSFDSAAQGRSIFSLCRTLWSTHAVLLLKVEVPLAQRRGLIRRKAATLPVPRQKAMPAQRAAAPNLRTLA